MFVNSFENQIKSTVGVIEDSDIQYNKYLGEGSKNFDNICKVSLCITSATYDNRIVSTEKMQSTQYKLVPKVN